MSFTDDFFSELDKKKKKKKTGSSSTRSTNASGGKSYSEKFMDALGDDISPLPSPTMASIHKYGEDDIAPVKGGDKDSWFKSGGFSDGVDGVGDFFVDLGQTVLGTAADVSWGVAKGAGRMVEGLVDLGTYGVAEVADKLGADEFAEKANKVARYNATDEWTKDVHSFVDRYSILGNKADAVSEGLGQVGAIILTGAAGAAAGLGAGGVAALTTGATGLSSMGTNMGDAFESGATDDEAFWYGLSTGAIEAGTELLFGGLGKGVKALGISRGIGGLDEIFAKKLSSKIAGSLANESVQKALGNTVEYAVKAGGEGVEEVLSGLGSAVMKKLTYADDKTLRELIEDENLLEQFVVGTVVSGIAQGGDFVKATKSGTDFVTGHTAADEKVIDKVVEEEVAKREATGEKLSAKDKNKIYDSVVDQMEKGQIDIDTIESVLGGDTYKAYKETVDSEDALKNELAELRKMKSGDMNDLQTSRMNELKGMNLDDTTKRDGLRKNLDDVLSPMLKDSKLSESYRERERRGQAFEADLSKYTGKQKAAVERAVKSGVLNNTYRSHELVNVLSKIEAEKGIVFDYTNNAKLKESGFAVEGKTVNGFANKSKGTVTLNVQSAKAWQSVVGHEITHVLEGTDAYSELRNALYAYAESKGELEGRRASLTALYQNMDADIESELTADLIGDYLFTDKAFINNLTGNRTLFQKIYDEIKYLWNAATGKEKTEIEKVKAEFDRAWKEYSNNNEEISEADDSGEADIDYSISVTDTDTLNSLNEQVARGEYDAETNPDGGYYVTYKSMSFWGYDEDGNAILRSPMAEYVDGELSNAYLIPKDKSKLNWYQATETIDENTGLPSGLLVKTKQEGKKSFSYLPASENQHLINEDWTNLYFNLRKKILKNGKWVNSDVPARYNPYEHSSNSMLNDQFTAAYQRDNLVTVKMYVPISEDNGAYRAKWSKDPTGWSDWKSGIVAGKIGKQKDLQRRVYLSRYAAPVEIVPDSEVAQAYKGYLEGTDVAIPDNVVSPNLLSELRKAGVPIEESGKVQYSISDSNGNELSLAVQKRFANSKAVDENGNLKVLYHGTYGGEFYTFDKSKGNVEGDFGSGFYFTDSEYDVESNYEDGGPDFENKVARRAEQIEAEEEIDYHEAEARAREELYKGGNKFEVYLNIENPAIVGETYLLDPDKYYEEYDREDYDSEEDYEGDVEQLISDDIDQIIWDVENNVDVYSTDGLAEVLWNAVNEGGIDIEQLKKNINDLYLEDSNGNLVGNEVTRQVIESLGYDGIIDPTVSHKWNMDMEEGTTHYIVFKPNQIKDISNQNPTDDPDIRFSLSNSVEETKDLMALHNLQSSELAKTLELGGLPMPSIAVIKDTMSHEEYGDVSLILPKEAIDPQANKDNKVYGGDAWTPTYPKIEYKPNEKVAKKIRDKYYGLANNIGYDEVRPLYNYVNDLENTLNRDGGESSMLQKLYENTGMMNVYLQDSGKGKVENITNETVTKISEAEAEMNQFFIDALGYDFVAAMKAPEGVSKLTHTSAYLDQHDAEIREAYKRYFMEVHGFTQEEANNALINATKTDLMKIMLGAYRFTQNKGVTVKTETDYDATEKAIRAKAADGYKEWVDGLFKGIEEKSGIRNNQDYYTRSGNPRSWDALHWENTLENVVKVMKGQDETGVGSFSPFNTLFGASHKRYNSIQDIKADSGRLGEIDQDEYDAMKDSFSERFAEIAASIKDPDERNQFIATDTAAEQIIEAVRTRKTKTGILNHLKSLNSSATMQTVDDVLSLVSDIANMPTGYFEAKPQRAVGLDEVGVFVIPRNADVKLKQELLNRGYSIAEYDPDVEGDRQKVVNQFEEHKFSLSNVGEEYAPAGNYSTPFRELALDGDIAPVKETATEAPSLADIPVLPDEELEYGTYEAIKPSGEMTVEAPLPNEIRPMTEEEANVIQDEKAKADAAAEGVPKSRKQLHSNIINDVKATFSSGGFDFDDVLLKAKDLSTFSTVDNTPQRVMEKALGYKEGQVLADLTVNKVAQNETKGIKWLNSFTDRKNGLLAQISNQYRIKPGSKESAAAQMYAEGFYVNDNNDIVAYGDAELAKDFPDVSVQNRIKGLAGDPRIRQIYDETLEAINKSRARNAYPEIQRLENYFLHFRAMDDTFSKLGIPFNPNDIRAKDLPTDLNGVTADLKPGQPYFASSMHRKGKRTSFDLLGGLERYLTAAKNQIYHIDDIQTLRALRNYIADTYGQAKGLEVIDLLSEEEAQDRIEKVYDAHLSTFAKFLNEEANVLAGKTALIDRGLEGIIGRRGMTFLDTVNRQVGSNMVGFNISSSLTNFLPVAQTFAKTNKFDFLKAFTQTVSNKFGSAFGNSDSFTENSPVIIRRKGADRFYRTPFQKAGDAGYALMSAVDDISTELIARTKFNELTRKGMDEQTAHFETDKWVSRLMGDRSLGQQPQLYNSKMLGVLTKFQLEVRNQLDSQFYDTIQEAKVSNEHIENALARNAKTAAKVTATFVELAVVQHLFGKAFESVAGYNPAFDIISTLATMFGWDDDEESEDTVLDNIEQGFLALLEDLPYTSTLTGGRIPIANALPITELIKGTDSYGNEKSRWETLGEAAPYYILPGGYGQIKKTAAGLNMFSDDHPVTGSYTDSGKLRFPVEDTPLNRVQAAVFGQYASKNAREYFDNDYAPLSEKQIQEYIDVDMPIKEYREYREGLKKQETLEDKFDYISGLDLPVAKKNILINNVVDRKEAVDLENYEDFGSLEEFDFATKNPEKYAFAKSVGGYSAYKTYSKDLGDFHADKDENGKKIKDSRKEKVLNYINNLDADFYTKIILFKSEYPGDDTYNRDIVNYINEREDLSYEDRVAILSELGFRVTADGQIYAD